MKPIKVLVPLDGSYNSQRTVETLFSMKDKIVGTLTLLHVFDHDRISYRGSPGLNYATIVELARGAGMAFLEEQKKSFAAQGMEVEVLFKEGPARKTICDIADSGEFDLLIMSRHTEGEIRNLLFGQVANYVIHKVKTPVLII